MLKDFLASKMFGLLRSGTSKDRLCGLTGRVDFGKLCGLTKENQT